MTCVNLRGLNHIHLNCFESQGTGLPAETFISLFRSALTPANLIAFFRSAVLGDAQDSFLAIMHRDNGYDWGWITSPCEFHTAGLSRPPLHTAVCEVNFLRICGEGFYVPRCQRIEEAASFSPTNVLRFILAYVFISAVLWWQCNYRSSIPSRHLIDAVLAAPENSPGSRASSLRFTESFRAAPVL
jgi:hypothetical protein